jgi:hypothetical protein
MGIFLEDDPLGALELEGQAQFNDRDGPTRSQG